MEKNPRVEFCTMAPDTKFVRVNGEVVFDNDNMKAKENVFKVMPDLLKMYGSAENPAMSVFYLKDMHATIASLTEPETVLFWKFLNILKTAVIKQRSQIVDKQILG